jgi:putative transposase
VKFLGGRYVYYFNKKYGRSGTLWQGRFKAALIQWDRYFAACMRYIELNPVKAALVINPEHYFWSSCRYHLLGCDDSVVDNDFWFEGLSVDPIIRRKKYADFIRASSDRVGDEYFESMTNKGALLGD